MAFVGGQKGVIFSSKEFKSFRKNSLSNVVCMYPQFEMSDFSNQLNDFWFESETVSIDLKNTLKAVQNALDMWKMGIYSKSLNTEINHRPGLYTYLLELAYFTYHAPRLLNEVKHTANPIQMNLINSFINEELPHYENLIRNLEIEEDEILHHDPSPGCHAMLGHLRNIAQKSPFILLTSLSVLEVNEINIKSAKNEIKKYEKTVGISLRDFWEHISSDHKSGHSNLWKKFLMANELPSEVVIGEAINQIHVTRHIQMMWLDSIAYRAKEANEMNLKTLQVSARDFLRRKFNLNSFI